MNAIDIFLVPNPAVAQRIATTLKKKPSLIDVKKAKPKSSADRIEQIMRVCGKCPTSMTRIVYATGLAEDTISRYLRRLIKDGVIVANGKGVEARYEVANKK